MGIWSIKVFCSHSLISRPPHRGIFKNPTLQASDVTDVSAEFIADPFILLHDSKYYMFFEVLDKSSGKGVIGFATSENGERWNYEKIVLKEKYHLSYPYVFKFNDEFYMIPESCEANRVLLYKAKNFPYEWDIAYELLNGSYVDSSIFQYDNKWWMLTGQSGNLHLFFSDSLEGEWQEHPKSPLITNNNNVTRPGGRVIVDENKIYRYAQDGEPNYGSSVSVFEIKEISEKEYIEEEVNIILSGTNSKHDWRKDGMHSIDQLKIKENEWLVAVDGHKLVKRNYLLWKLDRGISKFKYLLILVNLDFILSYEFPITTIYLVRNI
ncbi:hypothetical protein [Bacillus salipaludis]|uniref:Glucosamine inositolphosphorylceramide transferase 1 N-terminal domain-containing protein n=1 Tax=Bacillus salipaludis TaxID=2547811 RepID=A0ABW8R925_9BACI